MYPNKYISVLIGDCIEDELIEQAFYIALSDMSIDAENAKILKAIALDEKKHSEILSDIYKKLNNKEIEQQELAKPNLSESFCENIEQAIMNKAVQAEKYRPLMSAIEDIRLRNYLFEIITDELKNCAMLNLIYTKCVCECKNK